MKVAACDGAFAVGCKLQKNRHNKATLTLTSLPGSRVGALQVCKCACARARCSCGSGVQEHGRLQRIQCWRGGVWHLSSENISNPVFQVPKSTVRPLLTAAETEPRPAGEELLPRCLRTGNYGVERSHKGLKSVKFQHRERTLPCLVGGVFFFNFFFFFDVSHLKYSLSRDSSASQLYYPPKLKPHNSFLALFKGH